MHHCSFMYNNVVLLLCCTCGWSADCQFAVNMITVELCAEPKNASANTVILDDSAFFHSHTGSDKLHHAPQTSWYFYKWQTPVREVVETCLNKSFRSGKSNTRICVIMKLSFFCTTAEMIRYPEWCIWFTLLNYTCPDQPKIICTYCISLNLTHNLIWIYVKTKIILNVSNGNALIF